VAKLKDGAICKEDLVEYLQESSDFAFEITVLRELISLGFSCEHAGTYEDPITKKTREFDIRARKLLIDEPELKLRICLSVECKNLKNNFPLLVHCVPREERECALDLIWASYPRDVVLFYSYAKRIPLRGLNSPYQKLDPVGKSCDQIGRRATNTSELIGNDGDVFEKISQSINAGYDLIKEAHYAADKNTDIISIIIPVLVVPNEKIWSVWYSRSGEIEREPEIECNLEYYLNKNWSLDTDVNERGGNYTLSHLEIVQISSISKMVEKYTTISALSSSEELDSLKLTFLSE